MDQQYPTVAKIPVLDTGKFEQWQFRMQQYLQHEYYALWKVIEFGYSFEFPANDPSTTTTNTTSGEAGTKSRRTVTLTTEDMQKKKNDVKARTTLLLFLPDEHQLRFSQLQFIDVEVEQDDLNQNFLTSLAPEWLMHTIVWRNMSDLDTMSLDDLYNHRKVYETKVQKKTEPNTQNMAFISSAKHSRGNNEVNTDSVYTASTNIPTASANVATELETLKQEKEVVDGKLAGLLIASKDLDNLIERQRSDKSKEGLGYTAIPPPPAQLYLSPKKDLSWTGLPECADDTVTDYSRPSPTVESSLEEDQNRNSSVFENVASPITPKLFVKFVKASNSQSKSKTDEKETPKKPPVKYAKQYRKPNKKPNVRGNQKNWNNLKSYQLGPDFVMKKKACFNCGDFNRLAYMCRKRVKRGTTRNSPPVNRKFSTGSRNFPTVNRKFSTASKKFPTGSTKNPTADMGMMGKAIKPSACWTWKPSQNLSNKASRNSISRIILMTKAIGTVAALGGCKITRKGTIKTGKLEFENVYFVKDLKDFKLLDDANILLRTTRKHNMYSNDLNNIVPHIDLTCLVAKESADECMIWHKRLGTI
nr:ribonuclease H-like domain-containing protein [Tanacetum cinerariifolium]